MTDYVQLDRALHGNQALENLDDKTRAEYDAIVAEGPVQRIEPTKEDQTQTQFWSEVNQYVSDVAADLEARGIDPNGPESHEYYVALQSLNEQG